ncbi:dienelactone hydrolase family protein [Parvibaculum sp.]|uniref:dienelactone hydrolase family protein n=1 Tax=Parvibaculum sp. TaxID=2024848 RepID=UPI000EC02BD6|nr:dienelactone hydrolase family protein [Parvibaculum sp.]MBO6666951.1 dienelactone hydrolase family protein [Parvibaculum sp.]MBO6690395.1 dienelactone hydrolase family protein [Parvibaculum sp.]MBO6713572.1 dienelactone hydrolase family protein [Parvibaculum sp.]HAC57387.1 dienelactone hydrolase [Rhodobiaceae bacterium]
MLDRYEATSFTHEGVTKPVYVRGSGPAVIVIHEIPGITPEVIRFADWVADAGFRVYMPLLIGKAGNPLTPAYVMRSIATLCISREFHILASNRSSPVTKWLRALAAHAHAEAGGKGVGAVGMCFSGNFALSMMMEPAMMAPVLSQPSMPFPLGAERRAALHVSPEEFQCVKDYCAKGGKVLGLRFKGDRMSPPEKFETLRRELGDAFEGIELDDKDANPDSPAPRPHSCLTVDLVDKEGEPTMEAAKRVISFFQERLLATAR